MKEEKILITENKDLQAGFEKGIHETINRCQELVTAFNAFQDFTKIETEAQFVELAKDPVKYFDDVIVASVSLNVAGRAKVVPSALAPLVGIDRDSWLNFVAGVPIDEGCQPCKKAKIRKGTRCISLQEYLHDKEYICFSDGIFYPKVEEMQKKAESFKLYAVNEKQKAVYHHWMNLVDLLNKHRESGYCPEQDIQAFAKATGLRFSFATNKFHTNEQLLASEIFKLK